mmetsp:Transcript_17365/g.37640  ORF Transcript_17365/g.37640 Transcript_17365/m.37640 type:complete len:299 (-) Transcript_17365:255-1151(-)
MRCRRLATTLLIVLTLCCSCTVAFSLPAACCSTGSISRASRDRISGRRHDLLPSAGVKQSTHSLHLNLVLPLRGGGDNVSAEEAVAAADTSDASSKGSSLTTFASLAPITALLQSAGGSYSNLLNTRPVLTKSITASLIFGLSDFSAQQIEGGGNDEEGNKRSKDWTRILTASLVGLLYFGPAAHAWYETIFKVLPGTSLVSTLQKAALGQLLFGPSFTCVFFASSLVQSGTFSLSNWFAKIKQDLPGAWAAGLSFWPLVDLVSYSLIPPKWIPLFVNFCSFVWTIYLSIVANRRRGD